MNPTATLRPAVYERLKLATELCWLDLTRAETRACGELVKLGLAVRVERNGIPYWTVLK